MIRNLKTMIRNGLTSHAQRSTEAQLTQLIDTTTPILSHTQALANHMRNPEQISENRLLNARFDITLRPDFSNKHTLTLSIKEHHPTRSSNTETAFSENMPLTLHRSYKKNNFIKKYKHAIEASGETCRHKGKDLSATVNARTLNYIVRKFGKYQKNTAINNGLQTSAKIKEKQIMQYNSDLIRQDGQLELGDIENAFIPKIIVHALASGEDASKRSISYKATQWGVSKNAKMNRLRESLNAAEEYAQLVQNEISIAINALSTIKNEQAKPLKVEIEKFQTNTLETAQNFKKNMAISSSIQLVGSLISGISLGISGSLLQNKHPTAGAAAIIAGAGLIVNALGHGYHLFNVHNSKMRLKHSFYEFKNAASNTWSQLSNTYKASEASFMDAFYGYTHYRDGITKVDDPFTIDKASKQNSWFSLL